MPPESTCPLCQFVQTTNTRSCENCGVDLALAAALAERALLGSEQSPARGISVSPEVLVPRLGERLVEQGFLTEQQLDQALAYQAQQAASGSPIRIGQALIRLGMIDPADLDRAITQQIFQLQDALRQANRDLEARVEERTLALKNALSRLSEVNQLKANFIANISHELRTPLTHIKGYTELLSEESLGTINDEQRQAFTVMERAIHRLETMINDLISFSVAGGDIALHITPFSAGSLCTNVLALFQARQDGRAERIETRIEESLPLILGDAEKITWVTQQLLDNALKFTPAAGRVALSARRIEGNRVRIAVADSGIGIPPEKLEEIFEPFHQLDASTTRKFGGTGLGLALVRRILEAHRTTVRVESEPGRGSIFSFTLPVTGPPDTGGTPE